MICFKYLKDKAEVLNAKQLKEKSKKRKTVYKRAVSERTKTTHYS